MAEKHFTAEEKLLNIIEHGMEQKPARQTAPGRGKAPALLSRERLKELLGLRSVNVLLACFCAAATCFWAFDFFRSRNTVEMRSRGERGQAQAGAKSPRTRGLLASSPDLSELVFESNRRNIFSLQQEQAQGTGGAGLVDYDAQMKNYKLVGIFWSEDSPQAMIENAQDGKTALFSEKDRLGEFTVRKITADKVVVGKDDKEWELR